jgi:hypothetical protein
MHTSRLSEEERRRRRLKSQIKVLRDGRREGSACSSSSMLSGVAGGPTSVLGLEAGFLGGSFGVGAGGIAGGGGGGFWAGQPGDGSVFGRGL